MNADRVTDEAVKAFYDAFTNDRLYADRSYGNSIRAGIAAADAVRDESASAAVGALIAAIASELARVDGYDPDDQHGGLYDLRWSGGPTPEPEGDAWSMDYLPTAERIAKAIANHASDAAGGQGVPDGWQLVPKVPTAEMRAAFQGDGMHGMSKTTVFIGDFDARYSDTLAAAPSPQEAT